MKHLFRFTWLVILPLAIPAAVAQEKSVNPGINKSFENPDVDEYVGRFERDGREPFDKRKEILAACHIKPGMTIADVGAGTGLFTRLFAPAVGEKGTVYAVDISKNFIEHIEKTCAEQGIKNVKGVVCSQKSVELPPDSIDLAFICDVYHHFEFPTKTMQSIHRALRPGGQVILIDFIRKEGKSSDFVLKHVRAGEETFRKEIEKAGFRVVDESKKDFLKTSYFLRFEKTKPANTNAK
jgi:predicted methyltransferase